MRIRFAAELSKQYVESERCGQTANDLIKIMLFMISGL